LELAPNDVSLRNDLGLSQALAGDFDDAITILRSIASAPGAPAEYRLNLALALGLAGRRADAERVARIDLDERSVQSNLAYYDVLRALPATERARILLRGPSTNESAPSANGQ
jgi:Flp pilus assembly protein TadD